MGTRPSIVIFVGSMRNGASAKLAAWAADEIGRAGGTSETLSMQNLHVAPCRNCDGCVKSGRCIITDDDSDAIDEKLIACDGLLFISPVHFAGPPSQVKAVLDRFQPHFVQRYLLGMPMRRKRPARLVAVGAGGDPFGYDPLVTCTRSALNVADFRLGEVDPFIGIDPKAPSDEDRARIEEIAREFTASVAQDMATRE